MTSSPSNGRSHAVVLGASIGGACAAEALSRHFERVTLVERDRLSDRAEPRRGVPQGIQPHGLLSRGRRELDALFPGLLAALKAQGAFEFDGSTQMARLTPHGWAPRYANVGASAFACTRPLLELTMRKLLLARRSNVRVVDGVRVEEPLFEPHGSGVRVTGVRTDSSDPALRELRADLVVDATGRGTKAPRWMQQMGLPTPEEVKVDAKCNYATRHYRAPAEASQWWWKALLIDNAPPEHARSCSILSVEGGRWIVTAIGTNGDYAPSDEAGWLGFIESLRSPIAHELLQKAEPLTEVVQNRTTVNWWKQMHRYRGELSGLLLFGDAVCGFNPSYGQGVTASALCAQTLAGELERTRGPVDARFLRRYYDKQASFTQDGWVYSTTLDLRWARAEGRRPPLYAATQWAASLLERIAIHDPHMLRRLIPLLDFGTSRYSVLTPDFMARAAFGLARHVLFTPRLPGASEIDVFEPAREQALLASG
jgi:2-polyprenyl-6-methoxyphenol hydroxylase-like FAD-dependent oxidoreductase